jgi:hypothetical protein
LPQGPGRRMPGAPKLRLVHPMTWSDHSSHSEGAVSILFHPSTVPIIDIFRSISRLDHQYDLALLDAPEEALKSFARPETAKAIISDALLFAFALARQRAQPVSHCPLGSRQGTTDEYCLMALIGSSHEPDSELAFEAAMALAIPSMDFMATLAADLLGQIHSARIAFDTPSVADFRAIVGDRISIEDNLGGSLDRSEIKFRF